MIFIGAVAALIGWLAGIQILLWIGIGFALVGLLFNLAVIGPPPSEGQRRRWRYY